MNLPKWCHLENKLILHHKQSCLWFFSAETMHCLRCLKLFDFYIFGFCFAFVPLPTTCVCIICCVWRKEIKNCMCCSSWLQYRICHSLSTIQYVLVPQVQRQLQTELLHAAGSSSRSRSRSGSRPGSPLQLRWRGRNHQAAGSSQNKLRNSQCQDSRETHTCEGEKEHFIHGSKGKDLGFANISQMSQYMQVHVLVYLSGNETVAGVFTYHVVRSSHLNKINERGQHIIDSRYVKICKYNYKYMLLLCLSKTSLKEKFVFWHHKPYNKDTYNHMCCSTALLWPTVQSWELELVADVTASWKQRRSMCTQTIHWRIQ